MALRYMTDHGPLELTEVSVSGPGQTGTILSVGTNVIQLFQPIITPSYVGTLTATLTNGSKITLECASTRFTVSYYDKNGTFVTSNGQSYTHGLTILDMYVYMYTYGNHETWVATDWISWGNYDHYANMLTVGKTGTYPDRFYQNSWDNFFGGADPVDDDPYAGGGNSATGGGTGNFDGTSDTVAIPTLPTITGLNTGFFTAFCPSQAQLQSVSTYLWTNVISDILDPNTGMKDKLDALKTIVANPYDSIMGCSLVPVAPTSLGSKELKMYGVIETGITLPYAASRWVDVDCGTLNINEFWGAYLDYSPYTKTTSLYLPYIGTVSIDVDLIMGKALRIYYRVDILSGSCMAYILIDGSVKFSYHGNCAVSIPITSADYSGAITAGLGLVGSVSNIVGSAVGGSMAGGAGGAIKGAASAALSNAPSIAGNVMGMKPDIKSGGAVGGAAGFLGVQKPYLIIERPNQSLPRSQYKFTGYPLNMVKSVGECSGYTEFDMILLDGISLTDSEKKELENILESGVYL